MLHPFWRYYGGKWRAARHYPPPTYNTIIEPFAGAAGYALHYPKCDVILVEKYPAVAEIWRYLIGASPSEVRRIPYVEHVDALPDWVPQGARYLIGFIMNSASAVPCKQLSSGRKKMRSMGRQFEGWSDAMRERVATQVNSIRHWKIIEGDYTLAPDIEATFFIDPPYNNSAGRYYPHHNLDYLELGLWCRNRNGQVIVCENEGAAWLPFEPFRTFQKSFNRPGSKEVVWLGDRR